MTDEASAIGERLRELRAAKGWNQEEAAHAVGVAAKTWNSWETGRRMPRMGSVDKIAETFGVNPSDLLPPDRLKAIEDRLDALEATLSRIEAKQGQPPTEDGTSP